MVTYVTDLCEFLYYYKYKVTINPLEKGGYNMSERIFQFKTSEENLVEKIVDDANVVINHIIATKGSGLPEHSTNSNVYLLITKGRMAISLNDARPEMYENGNILYIPFKTKMNIKNLSDEILEFFVLKAPNPKDMEK